MVMDKGLSLSEAENLVSSSGHLIDFIKLGFGTSLITGNLEKKIDFYTQAGIRVYLGGTLFEAFVIRNAFDEFRKLLYKLKLTTVEISDGSMVMRPEDKCNYIHELSKDFLVVSEVGSKNAKVHIETADWVKEIQCELDAGSWKVIAEARESGNVPIQRHFANHPVALPVGEKAQFPRGRPEYPDGGHAHGYRYVHRPGIVRHEDVKMADGLHKLRHGRFSGKIEAAFGAGQAFSFRSQGRLAQELGHSLAWLAYAVLLLWSGIHFKAKAARWASLLLLLATSVRVFIFDLWNLGQLYRVASFFGLSAILILVSFLYQRFLSGKPNEK